MSCSAPRISSRGITSPAGPRTARKPHTWLTHAAVIHDDITTADGEFDIFMTITPEDVQRVARTYFTLENRLVVTIVPRTPDPGAPQPAQQGGF